MHAAKKKVGYNCTHLVAVPFVLAVNAGRRQTPGIHGRSHHISKTKDSGFSSLTPSYQAWKLQTFLRPTVLHQTLDQ
jgi:hypothetical protein